MNEKTAASPSAAPSVSQLFDRAVTLQRETKLDEAERLYLQFLRRAPDYPHAWTNLGALLRSRGLYPQSIAAHRRALRLSPGLGSARRNLANALADHGCFEEAERRRRELHETEPEDLAILRDLCAALRGLGRDDEVIALIDAAEARLPDLGECLLQRALSHLMKGNYRQGFADYEIRHAGNEVNLPKNAPWPRWSGEGLRGRSVLVLPEQGFGDEILASRFLPGLKALGAEVTMLVKPPLRRLLADIEGLDQMIETARQSQRFDFYTPNMSLPGGRPPPLPRLAIPDDSRSRARALVAPFASRFRIGVVWTGSVTYRANNRRSTGPESFLGLASAPWVQLFSLYKGLAHEAFLKSGMAGLIVTPAAMTATSPTAPH